MRNAVCGILLVTLLFSVTPPARAATDGCPDPAQLPPSPFSDLVSAAHRAGIACGAWYDLVNGVTPSSFAPLRSVRRDQMASFLARTLVAAEVPLPSKPPQPFTDVAASSHREAIAQMAELNLVEGTDERTYEPAAPVRRGQMAAFLVRLAGRLEVAAPAAPDAFSDDDGTAHEAAINQAVALGLARGVSAQAFAPTQAVRREQMASFLARLVDLLVDHGALKHRPIPAYASTTTALSPEMRQQMTGVSWRPQCPVPLEDLVVLEVTHWAFDARARRGHLVVARTVARDLAGVFRRLYAERFQIERMRPMHTYKGRELASLNDNNTSAHDCRNVTGGSTWSQHSYGTAIDINPRQNPYIKGSTLLPSNAGPWVKRSPVRRGMIARPGPVTAAFRAIGWGWGGDYKTLKDYQHFSATGG